MIGSSSVRRPRSRSCMIAMAVNVLVMDAQWKIVLASTRRPVARSAAPWNSRASTESPRRNQRLPPTTPSRFRPSWKNPATSCQAAGNPLGIWAWSGKGPTSTRERSTTTGVFMGAIYRGKTRVAAGGLGPLRRLPFRQLGQPLVLEGSHRSKFAPERLRRHFSAMTAPLASALADRYRIERELGAGGMATVYLAQDLKHNRPVAIKVLRQELAAAIGPDRFLREIGIAARLQHPHILSLHDSGNAGGLLYYVMPYVEGESLRDRLIRERQLPLEDALAITRDVADALSYAHARDIVHRDIKPENILLASGHALVVDFGIARAVSAAGGDALTETGMAVGTPAYMSPEQALGGESLDGRSDTYSLGTVLYEMLAGAPPFTGPTAQAIMARKAADMPPPIRTVRDSA